LSPAYDLNPSVDRPKLTLAMNDAESACEVSIFRSPWRPAVDVLKQVQEAVAGWREEATRLNIPQAQPDLMAKAFHR